LVCFSQYEHGRIATGRNVFKETINCPSPFPPRILFGDADKVSNDKNREAGGACPSDFFARSGLSGALMLQLSYPPLHIATCLGIQVHSQHQSNGIADLAAEWNHTRPSGREDGNRWENGMRPWEGISIPFNESTAIENCWAENNVSRRHVSCPNIPNVDTPQGFNGHHR
jgi:hypothetical protein